MGVGAGEVGPGISGTGGGGGGTTPGVSIVRKFPFAFNSPGILTGHILYTPTIGDILLDAWIEIDTAWNGTTPSGDIGAFATGLHTGFYHQASNGNSVVDMTVTATPSTGLGIRPNGQSADLKTVDTVLNNAQFMLQVSGGGPGLGPVVSAIAQGACLLPAPFISASPVKIVVSQDGTNNGADPASTMGAAVLYLVTATPV